MKQQISEKVSRVWKDLSANNFELPKKKFYETKDFVRGKYRELKNNRNEKTLAKKNQEEKVPLSADPLNLDAVAEVDRGSKVKYSHTENAEISRGEDKEDAKGIDSFGERDTFDFDEADDFQTDRDRNQNSDLAERYYTRGLDLDKKEKRH